MGKQTKRQRTLTLVIRWSARVLSIASLGLVLLFLVGEGLNPKTLTEWLGFFFFPVGICVGMTLAWLREGLGGSITIGSLLLCYAIHLVSTGTFPSGKSKLCISQLLFVSFVQLGCDFMLA
jgi:hypothetical protein